MTVLCDYIEILGDNPQTIPQTAAGAEVRLGQGPGGPGTFNTGGRESGTQVAFTAFLIYSVRDLAGSAEVAVNNATVGFITAKRRCSLYHADDSADRLYAQRRR